MVPDMTDKPKFYQDGLRFECLQCGNCCRQPGGIVEVSEEEISEMSHALRIESYSFKQQFCRPDTNQWQLKAHDDGACIFLKDNRCILYDSRPLQCRTFPFWPENLKSHYRWKQLKQLCPGIDKGRIVDVQEIQVLKNSQKIFKSANGIWY